MSIYDDPFDECLVLVGVDDGSGHGSHPLNSCVERAQCRGGGPVGGRKQLHGNPGVTGFFQFQIHTHALDIVTRASEENQSSRHQNLKSNCLDFFEFFGARTIPQR